MPSRSGPENSTLLHYLKIMRNKYLPAPVRTDISFSNLHDILAKTTLL